VKEEKGTKEDLFVLSGSQIPIKEEIFFNGNIKKNLQSKSA